MMLNGKRVVLLDKEGNKFEVSPETIQLLGTVKLSLSESIIDDDDNDIEIPVPSVSATNLERIISFCKHVNSTDQSWQTSRKQFLDKFFAFNPHELASLLNAAELLDCMPLREECLNIFVDYIQTHTSDQIREHFGLPDDLTDEEKEEQRKKNAWCYDPLSEETGKKTSDDIAFADSNENANDLNH